jgi:hypothetical protein
MIHASGTPPTRVLTVNNPQLAASNMAMQNASVKELPKELKKWDNIQQKHKFILKQCPKYNPMFLGVQELIFWLPTFTESFLSFMIVLDPFARFCVIIYNWFLWKQSFLTKYGATYSIYKRIASKN